MADIEKRIIEMIAEQLGKEAADITAEMSFADDLGADSLDLVELIMPVEGGFRVEISLQEAQKIKLVQDAIDFVNSKL